MIFSLREYVTGGRRVSLSARVGCAFELARPTTVTLGGLPSVQPGCNHAYLISVDLILKAADDAQIDFRASAGLDGDVQ